MPNPSSFSSFSELGSENNKNINNFLDNDSKVKPYRNAEQKKAKAVNDTNTTLHLLDDEASGFSNYIPTSEFSAGECGEPMFTQNLRIDFTPVAGVDDDTILEKKCSDFWAFIRKQLQIKNLEVQPMKEDAVAESISCVSEESPDKPTPIPPAVCWLRQEVGQPAAFVGKPQKKYCDLNGSEETNTIQHRGIKQHNQGYLSKEAIRRNKRPSHLGAVDLCKQLEDWDRRHPRSMEPPGQVPTLLHAELERNRD